jgi:hypothetical protein
MSKRFIIIDQFALSEIGMMLEFCVRTQLA